MISTHDQTGIRPFIGEWLNTASDTLWLQGFKLEEQDGQITIHPQGITSPTDWGKQVIESFAFGGDESAFYTHFTLSHPLDGQISVDFMAYTNKGLIVVAVHLAYAKTPGRNHLSREFFVPKMLGEQ